MKNLIIRLLHALLGYENYLTVFSIWRIRTLGWDSRKKAYRMFLTMLSSTDNVVVAGANTGITTVPFKRTSHVKQLFAYEPIQSNFNALRRVVNHFGFNGTRAFNVALGATNEKVQMVVPKLSGTRKHGLAYVQGKVFLEHSDGITEDVQMVTLDSRKELEGMQIDAIKVVAENSELEIFQGANKLIERCKPLIYCELWDNERRAEVFELIQSLGYQILVFDGRRFLEISDEAMPSKFFLFTPHDHF